MQHRAALLACRSQQREQAVAIVTVQLGRLMKIDESKYSPPDGLTEAQLEALKYGLCCR